MRSFLLILISEAEACIIPLHWNNNCFHFCAPQNDFPPPLSSTYQNDSPQLIQTMTGGLLNAFPPKKKINVHNKTEKQQKRNESHSRNSEISVLNQNMLNSHGQQSPW